jgi:hypothetical protein
MLIDFVTPNLLRRGLNFLDRWPTLRSVKQARTATLEAFFHAHHCRSARRISARIGSIREAAPLTEDPAIIGPCRLQSCSSSTRSPR